MALCCGTVDIPIPVMMSSVIKLTFIIARRRSDPYSDITTELETRAKMIILVVLIEFDG